LTQRIAVFAFKLGISPRAAIEKLSSQARLDRLFPVLKANRSAKFKRRAARYSRRTTRIAASGVRNCDLSYPQYPADFPADV
jgi:hypothetical protein